MTQTNWSSLGTPVPQTEFPSSPTTGGRNADGRLEVFAETGGALWHAWQIIPGGSWG